MPAQAKAFKRARQPEIDAQMSGSIRPGQGGGAALGATKGPFSAMLQGAESGGKAMMSLSPRPAGGDPVSTGELKVMLRVEVPLAS